MADTLGTASTTSLTAITMLASGAAAYAHQLGDVNNAIKYPDAAARTVDGALSNGFLYIPNRGTVKVLPGDVVAYDSLGWPILIAKNSIANSASWHYV